MLHPALLDDLGGPSPQGHAAALRELAEGGRPLPGLVAWSLAPACPRRCATCRLLVGDGGAGPGELSTIECLHQVHQITSFHPCTLLLTGGNALQREDLETIASHAARRGARVALAVPAGALTEARLRALQSSGVSALVVALTTLRDDRHARLGHGGSPAAGLAAAAPSRDAGLRLVVHARLGAETFDETAALVASCAGAGAHALHVELDAAVPRSPEARSRAAAERELLVLARRHARRLAIRAIRRPAPAEPCCCPASSCRILPDGKVTPCPCSAEIAGDLRRRPFSATWLQAESLQRRRAAAQDVDTNGTAATAAPTDQLALEFSPRGREDAPR